MITKNDIALAAYEELRISGLTSAATPSEITTAVRRLDNMMGNWRNKNLCLNYTASASYNDIDPNQDSGLTNNEMFAVVANLAKNLCSTFGKICHPQTKADAKEGYENLFSVVVPLRESDHCMPVGSGSFNGVDYGYRSRYQSKAQNAPDNCDTLNLKVGQTDIFYIDFNHYLLDSNTIASYVLTDGQGVKILTHSQADGVVTIKAQGLIVGFATIKITVTSTPSERVNPRTVNFNVTAT